MGVCRVDAADHVTIQWSGIAWPSFATARMQVTMWQDGHIDLIYADNHAELGAIGTVGVESIGGGGGQQLSFDEAGFIVPGASKTLTPAP